jgi:flagellar biogenesis protein FliO
MSEVSLTQVIVVVGFLAVLIAVQIVLRRNAHGIGNRLGRGREIRVVEVTAIGPNDRLCLVETGGQRILVLTGRHGAGAFLHLGPQPPTASVVDQ